MGLAIYNGVLLDVHFPLIVYKKLLGMRMGLNDLMELSPAVGRSLKSLLEYDKDDLEEVFFLNFTVDEEVFGGMVSVNLKENGENIPVTQANKHEYVELYVDYILNKSIENQFNSFYRGCHNVIGEWRHRPIFEPSTLYFFPLLVLFYPPLLVQVAASFGCSIPRNWSCLCAAAK